MLSNKVIFFLLWFVLIAAEVYPCSNTPSPVASSQCCGCGVENLAQYASIHQGSQDIVLTPCLFGGYTNSPSGVCGDPVTVKGYSYYRATAKNLYSKKTFCDNHEENTNDPGFLAEWAWAITDCLKNGVWWYWGFVCMDIIDSQTLVTTFSDDTVCQQYPVTGLKYHEEGATYILLATGQSSGGGGGCTVGCTDPCAVPLSYPACNSSPFCSCPVNSSYTEVSYHHYHCVSSSPYTFNYNTCQACNTEAVFESCTYDTWYPVYDPVESITPSQMFYGMPSSCLADGVQWYCYDDNWNTVYFDAPSRITYADLVPLLKAAGCAQFYSEYYWTYPILYYYVSFDAIKTIQDGACFLLSQNYGRSGVVGRRAINTYQDGFGVKELGKGLFKKGTKTGGHGGYEKRD